MAASTQDSRDVTLSRGEQMWITAEVNGPGWNLFYGIALVLTALFLAVSVFMVGLEWSATAISVGMAVLIAVGGIFLGRRGVHRIIPLRRLRSHRAPVLREQAEVTGLTSTRELILRRADASHALLRGPLPATDEGEPAAEALLTTGHVDLMVFAQPDDEDELPAFIDFRDGCHAIGHLSTS